MQETYTMAWLTIFRTLDAVTLERELVPTFRVGGRTYSTIDAFTRLGFCLAVLIPHCTLAYCSHFTRSHARVTYSGSGHIQDRIPRAVMSPESRPLTFLDPRSPCCMMQENELLWFDMSDPLVNIEYTRRRTAAGFTAISVLYIAILEYLSHQGPDAHRAPSPPVILPRGVGNWSIKLPEQFDLTNNWERPWLSKQSMAALLDKITDAGCAWCGYYGRGVATAPYVDPPMLFKLYRKSTEDNDAKIRFGGTGQDRVGPFRIEGVANLDSGTVLATKQYIHADFSWEWKGIITPFGMVGRWGIYGYNGWWWIWPKEWGGSDSATRGSES
ncbi:hypothetical protein EVG20_g5176 [Dentipellis fragilis]|uniref:Uncharacterized protein n=1 Tax=Dentipellis fragilis TaxID=205917 RepID=A0A4Y9YW74_9AGAM|nr:hypothetical protein EVG20_g5176 [Dentipellis fragilis]